MSIQFGPAGQCRQAKEHKLKNTIQYLEYIAGVGLDAFEYSSGRGINLSLEKAKEIGEHAKKWGIRVSLHAPYFISLASLEKEKRIKSIENYIFHSAQTVDAMGGTRVVVHPGGLNKQTREKALAVALETLGEAQRRLDENGLSHIVLCPETMGKVSQLGDLDEVIAMCSLDERMIPCVDFGHMNARTHGSLKSKEDFAALLDKLENSLGEERARKLHIHFSKIEYSAGGEVRHLTFEDEIFGPPYQPLMELLVQRQMEAAVICESAGTQSEDALQMKQAYQEAKKEWE